MVGNGQCICCYERGCARVLLKIIPSMSADLLKGDTQSCQNKSEEDIPKSSPFDFVIKQFQGKRSSSGKRKEQPSAIQKFFSGFDFGKSEGKERQEVEETEINNCGADDQSEKENLSVEGNADTMNKSMWMHFNFICFSCWTESYILLPAIYPLARICF